MDVKLQVGDRIKTTQLMVTGLGKQKVILGFPWFEEMNPEINWKEGTLTWRKENRTPTTIAEVLDEEEYLNQTQNPFSENDEESLELLVIDVNGKFTPVWINAKTNLAMDMAMENNLKKKELSVTEMVPPKYHEFLDVFDEQKANQFPES